MISGFSGQAPRRFGSLGFTLIELLIVVGIISILSAIAVPNFLEAQTRAKVSRVKNDMRTLATGAEAYHVDNNSYPARLRAPFASPDSLGGYRDPGMGDVQTRHADMRAFTTPISYLTKLPIDIFENSLAPPNNIIDYWDSNVLTFAPFNSDPDDRDGLRTLDAWAFASVGPDGSWGALGRTGNFPSGIPQVFGGGHLSVEYDPTNGTVSTGNVSRTHSGDTLTDYRDRAWAPH